MLSLYNITEVFMYVSVTAWVHLVIYQQLNARLSYLFLYFIALRSFLLSVQFCYTGK